MGYRLRGLRVGAEASGKGKDIGMAEGIRGGDRTSKRETNSVQCVITSGKQEYEQVVQKPQDASVAQLDSASVFGTEG